MLKGRPSFAGPLLPLIFSVWKPAHSDDVALAGVFGWQLLNIVADLQFKLGLAFGGSDVLQTLQTGKEGSHYFLFCAPAARSNSETACLEFGV
jgi:hypothetical protein